MPLDNPLSFRVLHRDPKTKARTGTLELPHATVQTPVFMPVGTQATVKAMTPGELTELGFKIILGNTYHLHLRPGEDRIARAGGLHKFEAWDGAMLTDSGGFQVFSLKGLRKISEEGVVFQSHIDGSRQNFTPESVMRIQEQIGADIIMAFDECAPYPCDEIYARQAMERTHRWALQCKTAHASRDNRADGGWPQALFGIVQGATYQNLREESTRYLTDLDLPGYAVGGLAVGEPRESRNDCLDWCLELLPLEKPRYLMGVGTPLDILDAVDRGVDMFDCVLPTRNARNAQVFTLDGILNMKNAVHADDFGAMSADCGCAVCAKHSRAYIRHLFVANEILGSRLTTYHNLYFYGNVMERIRGAIQADRFRAFKTEFETRYGASKFAIADEE